MQLRSAVYRTTLVLVLVIPSIAAANVAFDVAARYGFDADPGSEYFHFYEVAAGVELERKWQWGNGWSLEPGVSFNAGILHAGDEDGFIGTIGPRLELNFPGDYVTLHGSVRAGGMSEHEYGDADLGGAFTFAEDIGIRLKLGAGFSAGYLFQHISNADIYDENPGVELHILEIQYAF